MLRPYLLAAVLTLAGMTPAFGYTEITQEQFLRAIQEQIRKNS